METVNGKFLIIYDVFSVLSLFNFENLDINNLEMSASLTFQLKNLQKLQPRCRKLDISGNIFRHFCTILDKCAVKLDYS